MPSPQSTRGNDLGLMSFGAIASAGIFIADLQLPLGYSISALYGVVVLLGLFVRWPRYPLAAAAVAT
ncbi:MAG TPA: hypothetical protein VML55_19255, partial [Planctomycetaceae bacterium]|nr:hypothetical protein [Planctomycetaceae bacterium]